MALMTLTGTCAWPIASGTDASTRLFGEHPAGNSGAQRPGPAPTRGRARTRAHVTSVGAYT